MSVAYGKVLVTGSHIVDSLNRPVDGRIFFLPVLSNGAGASYQPYGGGQVTFQEVSTPVRAGAFRILLDDTTLTNPANIGYSVRIARESTGESILGPGYGFVQPHAVSLGAGDWCEGGVADFDLYVPNVLGGLPSNITGPPGPPGAQGVPGQSSAGGGIVDVESSAAPVFDGSGGTHFRMTLAEDVLSSTAQNLTPGLTYVFSITQGPGPDIFEFVWPATLTGGDSISPKPDSRMVLSAVAEDTVSLLQFGSTRYF